MIEHRYQIFWRRFWAGSIDGLVFVPIAIIDPWRYSEHLPNFILLLWFLFHQNVWYFYSVLMHGRFGQTLGKMACGVKVVDKSEAKAITYRQAFLRDSMLIVLGLIVSATLLPDVLNGVNPYEVAEDLSPQEMRREVFVMLLYSSLTMFWFFAEVVTMLTNRKRRAVHDFIARSVVIRIS